MKAPSHFSNVGIEAVRDYWNRRPCNIRHSPSPVGTRQYFDEVEARKYFVEPHIPIFAEFHKWKGKKVLEIGCGIGTDTINFARAGAEVTAVDLSAESLAVASKRAKVYGLDNITFYEANAEHLNEIVPIQPYDLVYSFGVIHHTPHPERVIKQISNYMGGESLFKMMVYHKRSWKVLWMMLKYGKKRDQTIDTLIAQHSEAETGCPVSFTYDKDSVGELLEGFDVLSVNVQHIFPYRIGEYRNHQFKKVWYFRYMPDCLFRWMERNWGWHLCIESKLTG